MILGFLKNSNFTPYPSDPATICQYYPGFNKQTNCVHGLVKVLFIEGSLLHTVFELYFIVNQ